MENRNWIIIDCENSKALYGINRKTLRFSTKEIAHEVAKQFFQKGDKFILFNIDSLTH
jgi:hypothetical protein